MEGMFKELLSSWTIRILIILVIISSIHILVNGIRWGIDFVGGVRIPVVLEKPVDQDTMSLLVSKIKTRVSGFGLTQVKVLAVGDSLINVELPAQNEREISIIETLITKQGVFLGVVNGKVALAGESILQDTIMILPTAQLPQNADWGVRFNLDIEGAKKFAQAVKGEANRQIYMILDRPENFLIVIDDSFFEKNKSINKNDILIALYDALKFEGDKSSMIAFSQLTELELARGNYSMIIIEPHMKEKTESLIKGRNISLILVDSTEPEISLTINGPIVSEWKAVGILTSLTLSPEVTTGVPSMGGYVLSGTAEGMTSSERSSNGLAKAKEIVNILKSGSLPVRITLGNKKFIPSPLGKTFLDYSLIALALSITFISVIISLRYKKLFLILPVLTISLVEIIILVAIMGTFTIDLAAIAGIIAAIGVSVDSQIVITDELTRASRNLIVRERLKRAFDIVTMNAAVAICAMLPLLFSGITEIIGFAVATILGSLLGVLLSRPAYALIAKYIIEHEEKQRSSESV